MWDQNTIIQIVNTCLPAVVASPVAVKLISVVEDIIKTLYAPVLTLRNGKAEVDVELYKKQKNWELENKGFTLLEITKLKNFLNSAKFAMEELNQEDSNYEPQEEIDFDWLMRYFEAVGNIGNAELQKLWGKVLAGGIRSPGSCSLRTLDIIRNMTQKEAQTFVDLSKYILNSGDCFFIPTDGFCEQSEDNENYIACHRIIENAGLKYIPDVRTMIECGLFTIDNSIVTDFKTNNVLSVSNPKMLALIIANSPGQAFLEIDTYCLTVSGIELYKVIQNRSDFNPDIEYALLCLKTIRAQHPELHVTAHQILSNREGETFTLGEEDLLEC